VENAHLRMGKLTFVRQTKDSITNVTLHLDRLVAEVSAQPHASAALHFVSVFGGDQDIGAIAAAAADGQRFQIAAHGSDFIGTLGEKPVVYRASIQIPGRKRPVRHLIAISQELFATTFGANSEARQTILFDSSPHFVLHRLSVRFGLPVLPEWAAWFHEELGRRGLIEELVGLNCSPILVKGTKLRMLRILGQGLRRKAIEIPADTPTLLQPLPAA
jgi:hypothetical protein